MKYTSLPPTMLSALLLALPGSAIAQTPTPSAVSEQSPPLAGALSSAYDSEGDLRSPATRAPARDAEAELDYWARYTYRTKLGVTLSPISPAAMPPSSVGTGYAAAAAPGLAAGAEWSPSERLRARVELVMRPERLDADFRSQDWAAYAVPSLEYTPSPRARVPVSFGLAAPLEFSDRPAGESGFFVFVRARW